MNEMHNDSGGGFGFYFPGIMLILFGLLILYAPKLLALMVAMFFMSLGFMALGIGHKMRQGRKASRDIIVQWFEDK